MGRIMSRALILVGVLLIALAIALVTVIVPERRVFPDDVDTIRNFDVSYLTLLNPDTLEFFVAPQGESDAVSIRRHVVSKDVQGDSILVWEGQTLLNGEDVLEDLSYFYALDRTSMMPIPLDDAPPDWAALDGLWQREGLVVNWNVDGVRQEDYVGWNEDTRTTVDMIYQGEDQVGGMPAYYFTSSQTPQRIHPDQVADLGLPTALTLEQVAQLARSLDIDDPLMARMAPILLPQMLEQAVRDTQDVAEDEEVTIPLEYYYDYDGQYWVEPTTGVLLNTVKYEHRAATFPEEIVAHLAQSLEGLGRDPEDLTNLLPVTVSEFEYEGSEAAQADAMKDAQDAKDQLDLFGKTLPIALVIAGAVLILGGAYAANRNQPALISTK